MATSGYVSARGFQTCHVPRTPQAAAQLGEGGRAHQRQIGVIRLVGALAAVSASVPIGSIPICIELAADCGLCLA